MTEQTDVAIPKESSAWAPFGNAPFAVLWVATVVSNVGTWMNDVGAGWLMTELSPSPLVVASVQAATTLPVFLFALLAGAIADIVDRRKMLLVVNGLLFIVVSSLAVVVFLDEMTSTMLLVFTFLIGTGAAFLAPAWQAIVPKLVPRDQLTSAIALNSMGINVSRAIGPALAGFLIVTIGIWSPFAVNAASFLVILVALWWWTPPESPKGKLSPEHVGPAIVAGLRYAAGSKPLQATLLRAAAFFVFASAYWAMLPLIARQVLDGGPTLYGVLLAAVGGGAVVGALILPLIRKRLGPDATVAAATFGTALVLTSFALIPTPVVASLASAVAGLCWIAVLSTLHVSAQTALPDWVRARGLSVFLTVFFGAMSGGSLIWGQVASTFSIQTALLVAAAGAVLLIPLSGAAKLGHKTAQGLSPSGHWPEPVVTLPTAQDSGPVMIQIIYDIDPDKADPFSALMDDLRKARRRGGGYGWTLMQDVAKPSRFVETWFEASWIAHLRHHERVSVEDQGIQDRVHAMHRGEQAPAVQHLRRASREG